MKPTTHTLAFDRPLKSRSPLPSWGMGLAIALIGLSTLFRAGNRHLPLLALEWLAIGVLAALFWRNYCQGISPLLPPEKGSGRSFALVLLLTAPFWVGVVQLTPLPSHWWTTLGGRDIYVATPVPWQESWMPASLAPTDTWLSILAGIPVVACLALALVANDKQLRALLLIWVGVGVFQAVFGLFQLSFPNLLFKPNSGYPVLGTFGNRNGLANYFVMLLPVVMLALLTTSARSHRKSSNPSTRWGWSAALLLIVAGLMATTSRMGVATGALVMLLALILLRPVSKGVKGGSGQVWRWALLPPALVLVALLAGGWEWLARFDSERLLSDSALRRMSSIGTLEAIQHFGLWGSGLGSFGAVFPAFQDPQLGRWFVNFAHNDYLQLVMECGVLVLPLGLAVLWLVYLRLRELVHARTLTLGLGGWQERDALALACGLGVLAQAMHAWVDYPWRIPANAMLGAFMLGVFLRSSARPEHPPV